MLESIIGLARPFQLKGKGLIFNYVTPRSGKREVPVWGEYLMTLDLANVVHRQIFMGCFGRYMTQCTRALLPLGGTFLDVGAHAGYFTLLASHCVGVSGHVYAIEPTPSTFATLLVHLERNRVNNVQASMIALSDATGTLRLHIPPASEYRDYNVTSMGRSNWTAVDVPCQSLDDYCDEWRVESVDLMKIDVEGGEPRVLEGGAQHLRQGTVKHIIVEINGPRLTEGGSSPTKLVGQLAELGFRPGRLSGGRAVQQSLEHWDLNPEHEYDRLFVHRSML